MAWLFPIIRFGIGYGLPPGIPLTDNWKSRTVWGLATLGLTSAPVVKVIEQSVVRGVPWIASGLWSASNYLRLGAPLASGGRAVLATGGSSAGGMGVGAAAGAVTAGVALGVVAGTGVAYAGWGEKGARDAIDFYTDPKDIPRKYMEVVFPALNKKGLDLAASYRFW